MTGFLPPLVGRASLWRRLRPSREPEARQQDSVDDARQRLEERQRRERALELELDSYGRPAR